MNKSRLAILLVSMVWMLSGCGNLDDISYHDGGTCPTPKKFQVESDRFGLSGSSTTPNDFDPFPAVGASVLNVDVDRDASRVTVTYTLEGKTVVERYKISDSEMR